MEDTQRIDMAFDFGRMNPEQKSAVLHGDGPCVVTAGAGSGKTTVLTKKIEHMLTERKIDPKNILAITFTKKAATEMKERLIALVGEEKGNAVFLGTFHRFGLKLIWYKAHRDGREREKILNEFEQRQIVSKILASNTPILKNNRITSDIDEDTALAFISWQKNYLIFPNDELDTSCLEDQDSIDETYLNDLRTVYKTYELLKNQNDAIDMDDMLMKSYSILKKDRELRSIYQNLYKYILVDEFQDTNVAQYNLVKLLAGGYYQNVFIVGDARQAIYSWRASKVDFILNFANEWKNATAIELNDNYRSTIEIVDMSTKVIGHSTIKYPGICRSGRGNSGDPVYSLITEDENEEAKTIAYIIHHLVEEEKSIEYSDVAILYRLNTQSRPFEDAFSNLGIPYFTAGSEGFYGRKEIKELLAYLHLAENPNDMDSFRLILNVPERGISNNAYATLQAKAHEYEISISEAASAFPEVGGDEETQDLLADLGLTLSKLQEMNENRNCTVADMLKELVESIGYYDFLKERKKAKGRGDEADKKEMIESFIGGCERFPNVDKLFQHIQKVEEQQADRNKEKVQLMSLHRSKGLEFHTVFMVGMVNGLLPHGKSMKVDQNGNIIPASIEEERRLCYVGVTRAKETLFMCSYNSVNGKPAEMSVFLKEIINDTTDVSEIALKVKELGKAQVEAGEEPV